MEFVNEIYEFIMYLINTLKGLIGFIKGDEEQTTVVVDTDVTEKV